MNHIEAIRLFLIQFSSLMMKNIAILEAVEAMLDNASDGDGMRRHFIDRNDVHLLICDTENVRDKACDLIQSVQKRVKEWQDSLSEKQKQFVDAAKAAPEIPTQGEGERT